MNTILNQQLELGFAGNRAIRLTARQRRMGRASWWFARMREVVEGAFEWQPAPSPRPEQICFANAFRQPALEAVDAPSVRHSAEERLICE